MKRARSIFRKRLSLVISIIMLIGLLPFAAAQATEAAPSANLLAVKDATGVTATLNNTASAAVDASLIFAVYEPNGKLSYLKEVPTTIAAESSANVRFDYDTAAHPDYVIKVFAWDSLTSVPLCNEVTSALYITIDGSDAVYNGVTVSGDPGVTQFMYVKIDEMTRRGEVFTAIKSDGIWTFAKAKGVDLIIAVKPDSIIGGAMPDVKVSELKRQNGVNTIRVVISI